MNDVDLFASRTEYQQSKSFEILYGKPACSIEAVKDKWKRIDGSMDVWAEGRHFGVDHYCVEYLKTVEGKDDWELFVCKSRRNVLPKIHYSCEFRGNA